MIRTIAGRLFVSYLAVVAVALLVSAVALSGLVVRYEGEVTRQRLLDVSQPLLTAVQSGLRQGRPARDVIDSLTEQARTVQARVLVIGAGRRVLVDSEERLVGTIVPAQPTSTDGVLTFREGGDEWLYVQRSAAGGISLAVARPRAALGESIRPLLPPVLAGAAVAAGLALLLAALLARTITRPLRDLVRGAGRFAAGDMRARVAIAGPAEVRELGGAFNDMADEIERARGSEQAFLADISHELRTPLTSIQGFSQAIVEGEVAGEGVGWAARTIQREARRLVRMVEGLLEHARIGSAPRGGREPVRVDEVVRGAIAALEIQAREAEVEIRDSVGDLPTISGDTDRLTQLFTNVIDNAVKHSPKGGQVEVGATAGDGRVVVSVRDRGAGIPKGAEARVFDRFYRGEGVDREGTGLGLAIAQAIAQAHGGHVEARNVAGGAEFRIVLPASRA